MVRGLLLVEAVCRANPGPVSMTAVHIVAYLAEALAPVWGLESHERQVLKRAGSPYFPGLQQVVDDLICRGAVTVVHYDPSMGKHTDLVANATIDLVHEVVQPAVELAEQFSNLRDLSHLYLEVALAASRAPDLGRLVALDASYSNPTVSLNRLIQLGTGEPRGSAALAEKIGKLLNERVASRGEKISLYVGHLVRFASRRDD